MHFFPKVLVTINRLCIIIIFLLCSISLRAQTFIKLANDTTAFIEYNDGKQWIYRDIDDLTVGMTNIEFKDGYGKYYQVGLFINNNRDSSLIFNPEEVLANLVTNKGDTISLEVYTSEKYQDKIRATQGLVMLLNGLSAGLNAASAGYSTNYTTTYSPYGYAYTTVNAVYDANAAYQANMAANMQMRTLGKLMNEDRVVREQGYLKLNTVHSGNAIVGYMNIKHKKGKNLLVSLNIGGSKFSYLWNIEKDKKK